MLMFKRIVLITFIFSALMLTGCTEDKTVSTSELPDVIRLGYVGPLTGAAAAYGQDIKAGIDLYFSEHPTIGDKPVEVIYEDGKCNGADAAVAAQKLITVDKVRFIFGGGCSGETLSMAPIAEENKVVTISSGSSSPEVTTAGDYIFRDYPSDSKVAQDMAAYIASHDRKKVALLTEQTDFAQGYRMMIKDSMTAYAELELVADEAYGVDNADFRTLLTKAKQQEANALISIGQSPSTNGFVVKQAKELGLDVQIYGPDSLSGQEFFDIAKDAGEGVIQFMVVPDPTQPGYAEKISKLPEAQGASIFQLLGYDAAGMAALAIEHVGYDATAIKDYWYDMPIYKGIGGDHKFDENGDDTTKIGMRIAKDGEFVMTEE